MSYFGEEEVDRSTALPEHIRSLCAYHAGHASNCIAGMVVPFAWLSWHAVDCSRFGTPASTCPVLVWWFPDVCAGGSLESFTWAVDHLGSRIWAQG